MKSSRITLEQIADPENLREAFLKAARGKAHRPAVIAFRERLDDELADLGTRLRAGDVEVGVYQSFVIHEPKQRRIHAPCFRERVLHHALLNVGEADFERWQIDDSFACRRGKGREAAVRRAQQFARKGEWFLKLDVAKYFDSIPHATLVAQTDRHFRDAGVRRLWETIIHGYATSAGRGLPIGALTSQHLANFYLTALDRFIKEHLRIRCYLRYMDDMVLWGDKRVLQDALKRISPFAADALGLCLNPSCCLQPAARGAGFLGYRIFPFGVKLSGASRRRFIRRYGYYCRQMEAGALEGADAQRGVLALIAFAKVARQDTLLPFLFGPAEPTGKNLDDGHRARTGSTGAAPGTTPRRTAGPPSATGTRRTTGGTTSASASPSAHADNGRKTAGLNRPSSCSAKPSDCRQT